MTLSIIQLGSVQLNVANNTVSTYNKPKDSRIVEHRVPGRNNNIFQIMGQDSRVITITGKLASTSRETEKSTLEGYRGTTQAFVDGEIEITVIVMAVDMPNDSATPSSYNYTLTLKEYSQEE